MSIQKQGFSSFFQAFFKRGSRISILSIFDRILIIFGLHLETFASTFEGHFFRSQKSQNVFLGSGPGAGLSWTHPGEGGNWVTSGRHPAARRPKEVSVIVLSFAPSAAAVWHCDHVRIPCESNSVRHSVFHSVFCNTRECAQEFSSNRVRTYIGNTTQHV